MSQKDANEAEKDALAKEREKFGFGKKPNASPENSELNDEEGEDKGDLDEEEEKDEEDTDDEDSKEDDEEESDESEDESEEDEDEEEDDDDSEKDQSKKKKYIPFKKYNSLRTELREAQAKIKEQIEKNEALEAKLPDDFNERVDAFAKEIGVNDPDSLKKIVKFVKEAVVDKNTAKLEKKLSALEQEIAESKKSAPIVDEFPKEWESFETDFFSKEYPNATAEQKRQAKDIMKTLSHSPKTGGKPYVDEKTGREVLDPYPLDYIFYKNRDKFSEIVTDKKKRGMETSRSQGITKTSKDDGEIQHLPKNASGSEIEKLNKKYSKMESGAFDSLRSPENNEV